jgi:hypothetical protein
MPFRRRRGNLAVRLMLGLALAALVCAIAGRAVQFSVPLHAAAQCDARAMKAQQLASDAHPWSAPVTAVLLFLASAPTPAMSFEPQPAVTQPFGGSLYNRPPPVA